MLPHPIPLVVQIGSCGRGNGNDPLLIKIISKRAGGKQAQKARRYMSYTSYQTGSSRYHEEGKAPLGSPGHAEKEEQCIKSSYCRHLTDID